MKEVYLDLMENQWTIIDIDEMDFYWYLDLLIYKTNKSKKPDAYIDQII